MDEEYTKQMSPEFRSLFDTILLVSGQQLPVHKGFIAANSPVFAQILEQNSVLLG